MMQTVLSGAVSSSVAALPEPTLLSPTATFLVATLPRFDETMPSVDSSADDPETAATPSLGARLRDARRQAGLSQDQAGELIGSVGRSVARWEVGETAPTFADVRLLADAYGVSLDWLAGRSGVARMLTPGMVIVDETAQETMRQLVAAGKCLCDIPEHLIRKPGVDYAFVVPERWLVMGMDAARAVDAQIQNLMKQLRANTR